MSQAHFSNATVADRLPVNAIPLLQLLVQRAGRKRTVEVDTVTLAGELGIPVHETILAAFRLHCARLVVLPTTGKTIRITPEGRFIAALSAPEEKKAPGGVRKKTQRGHLSLAA